MFRNVSHESDFQEIRQVEASTKFREPSILDEESIGSFSRSKNGTVEGSDDLSDLLGSKKVSNHVIQYDVIRYENIKN